MNLQLAPHGAPPFEQRETAARSADVAVLVGVTRQGMRATPRFRNDFMRLSAAGRVGTTHELRKRFCAANHYEIDVPRQGKTARFRVAELWSLPFVYRWEMDGKPLLLGILPKGWHMRYVGRSIRAPAWCRRP
jgi:hypothetical protein